MCNTNTNTPANKHIIIIIYLKFIFMDSNNNIIIEL